MLTQNIIFSNDFNPKNRLKQTQTNDLSFENNKGNLSQIYAGAKVGESLMEIA